MSGTDPPEWRPRGRAFLGAGIHSLCVIEPATAQLADDVIREGRWQLVAGRLAADTALAPVIGPQMLQIGNRTRFWARSLSADHVSIGGSVRIATIFNRTPGAAYRRRRVFFVTAERQHS